MYNYNKNPNTSIRTKLVLMDYMDTKEMKNKYKSKISDSEKIDRLIPMIKQQENEMDESELFDNARKYELLLVTAFQYALSGRLDIESLKEVIDYYNEKKLFNIVYSHFNHKFEINSTESHLILSRVKLKLFLIVETLINYLKSINSEYTKNTSFKIVMNSEIVSDKDFLVSEDSFNSSIMNGARVMALLDDYASRLDSIKEMENFNLKLFSQINKKDREHISKKLKTHYASKSFN
ncbi:hypothetical protein CPT_Machias_273 [Staphylococcus phage Machias]|nr:hypothetical protein CPT_Machias_273 [Staphylococcus phage Machias]